MTENQKLPVTGVDSDNQNLKHHRDRAGEAREALKTGTADRDMAPSAGRPTVDVIIPAYHPGESFQELLLRLLRQTYPVNRIIIMNTVEPVRANPGESGRANTVESGRANPEEPVRANPGKTDCADPQETDRAALQESNCAVAQDTPLADSEYAGLFKDFATELSVYSVDKPDFDHGGTRHLGIVKSDAEICILMTQDAMPADRRLVEELVSALLSDDRTAAAYGRQLPAADCGAIERYTRAFNYPRESGFKTAADRERLGIKTYFCSNVCAAYRRERYLKLGGFIRRTIFNEDMIFAGRAVQAGYAVAYAADARVIHSHNYTAMEQLHRNFDLAVSQADHPEIFAGLPSEGEGIRLVKKTASHLLRTGKGYLLPKLVLHSGMKYLGYRLGIHYGRLPGWAVKKLTMNREYWR